MGALHPQTSPEAPGHQITPRTGILIELGTKANHDPSGRCNPEVVLQVCHHDGPHLSKSAGFPTFGETATTESGPETDEVADKEDNSDVQGFQETWLDSLYV